MFPKEFPLDKISHISLSHNLQGSIDFSIIINLLIPVSTVVNQILTFVNLPFVFLKDAESQICPSYIDKAEKQKEKKGRGAKKEAIVLVYGSLQSSFQNTKEWWDHYCSYLSFVGGSKAKGSLWSKRKENCMKHQEACDFNDQRPTFDYSYTNKGTKLLL